MAGEIDNCERAAVVALKGMVGECDEIAFRRDAGMADPSSGLVERLSDGKFQAVAATHITNHGQAVAIRGPVGPLHLFQYFAGSSSG